MSDNTPLSWEDEVVEVENQPAGPENILRADDDAMYGSTSWGPRGYTVESTIRQNTPTIERYTSEEKENILNSYEQKRRRKREVLARRQAELQISKDIIDETDKHKTNKEKNNYLSDVINANLTRKNKDKKWFCKDYEGVLRFLLILKSYNVILAKYNYPSMKIYPQDVGFYLMLDKVDTDQEYFNYHFHFFRDGPAEDGIFMFQLTSRCDDENSKGSCDTYTKGTKDTTLGHQVSGCHYNPLLRGAWSNDPYYRNKKPIRIASIEIFPHPLEERKISKKRRSGYYDKVENGKVANNGVNRLLNDIPYTITDPHRINGNVYKEIDLLVDNKDGDFDKACIKFIKYLHQILIYAAYICTNTCNLTNCDGTPKNVYTKKINHEHRLDWELYGFPEVQKQYGDMMNAYGNKFIFDEVESEPDVKQRPIDEGVPHRLPVFQDMTKSALQEPIDGGRRRRRRTKRKTNKKKKSIKKSKRKSKRK